MDIEKVIELAAGNDRLDESIAAEVLNYGISAFLEAGCSYSEALKIIEVASLSKSRSVYEKQYHAHEEEDES